MEEEKLQKIKDTLRPFVPRVIINERGRRRMIRRLEELSRTRRSGYVSGLRPAGVNLYGDRDAGTGLSMSVRTLMRELEEAGIPYSFHPVDERRGIAAAKSGEQTDYAVNVYHLQPPIWAYYALSMDRAAADTHYNIAHWAWETPQLPPEWIPACDYFDEIWTPSAFVARAVRRVCEDKPVRVMYHGICDADASRRAAGGQQSREEIRATYGIPGDAFAAILLYDGQSSVERKNPEAGVRAFCEAFPEDTEDAYLIIKRKHFDRREERRLERLLWGRRHIIRIDGELDYDETQRLIAAADVLISLHRAEGFGLPIAEAMRAGTVPLATDYSATQEIMDAHSGMPVDYRLLRTGRDYGLYRRGTVWAEPDIADAAAKLRRLYEEPELRERLRRAAQERAYVQLSARRIGERIRCVVEGVDRGIVQLPT